MSAPALRPFHRFIGDLSTVALRRLPELVVIAVVGWAPVAAAFAMALRSGLGVDAFRALLTDPAMSAGPAPDLVADPDRFVRWLTVALVAYLPAQAFVSAATSRHLVLAVTGARPSVTGSLRWGLGRALRTTATLVVVVAAVAVPLGAGLAGFVFVGWTPAAFACGAAGVAAAVAVFGRLSLASTVAAVAPPGTPPARTSMAGLGRCWPQALVRMVAVVVIVSGAVGLVTAPLLLAGFAAGPTVFAVALAARVVLSLASASFAAASAVVVYQDLDLPVDPRVGPLGPPPPTGTPVQLDVPDPPSA
jgi:hypothetical protein